MIKYLIYTIISVCFAFSSIFAMPLSPESVSRLKASGQLDEVVQRQNSAYAMGVDAPRENILAAIRQLHRDNPDEVTLRVLTILVDFSDNEADDEQYPLEHYEQLLFSLDELNPGSVREFYRENTYDDVDIIGEAVGWVRMPETYAYYVNRNNGTGGWPRNSQRMTYDAVRLIDDEVDFSLYDNNGNRYVDGLFIVHAGPGAESNDGNRDMIWSHAWGLNNNRIQLDGVWIDSYSTEPDDGQIGVFGHEAGHALFGLPDLYDRGYESAGLGAWSMMAGGCWGGEGRSPAHFDAWSKMQIGAIDPVIVNENMNDLEIPAIESEDASYIIWEGGEPGDEYFLIENRQQIGFDASLPASGLVIYHVDEAVGNAQNDREWFPGNEDAGHYLVAVEQADGNWDLEQNENRGDDGDPFPGSAENHLFDSESTPNSRAYSGQSTDVSIRNIQLDDGVVTCSIRILPEVPSIHVQPQEIESVNDSENRINIANVGEGILEWSSDFAVISQPGRDLSNRSVRSITAGKFPTHDPAGDPDGMGYVWVDNAENDGPDFEWIDISEIGTRLDAGDDWLSPWQEIGFVFPWYTDDYSQIRICSNGWASFLDHENGRYNWPQAPNVDGPNSVLFVNVFDLDPREIGDVYIWTNEEDTFIASWVDVPRYGNADHRSTFQCILHADGSVIYQYGPQTGVNGEEQNVGFESPDGRTGASIIFQEADRIEEGLAISIQSDWIGMIDYEPKTGELGIDEDVDMILSIMTDGIGIGDYEAELHILSNDPDNGDVVISVLISISRSPVIMVDPDNLDFAAVQLDDRADLVLTIGNEGDAVLSITDMSIDANGFEVDFAEDISIAPNEEAEVIVSFAPLNEGDYNGILTITSNDPNNQQLEIPLTGIGEPLPLQHFSEFRTTDINQSVLVLSLTHDEEPVPTGWEIGLFTPENLLAGAGVWRDGGRLGISGWGDDVQTQIIDGFRVNEVISFKIWDNETDTEYNGNPEIVDGNLAWQLNALTVVNLSTSGDREMTIAFRQGWNLISINVSPGIEFYAEGEDRGPDVEFMVDQLRIDEDSHHVILLKNENGQFFLPAFGFNNIPYWDLTQGYQVNLDEAVEAVYSGQPIPFDADVPLAEGWNFVAYYPKYELDASSPDFYVLSSIIDNVLTAKDSNGRFMLPAFNFSNMPDWLESQGYMIKVDQDVILIYPVDNNQNDRNPENNNHLGYWTTPLNGSQNMSLLVTSISGTNADQTSQIAALSSDGRVVGTGNFSTDGRCGIAVWGDDAETAEIEGLKDGEAFSLKIWNVTTNSEENLSVEDFKSGSGLVYRKDEIIVLTASVEVPIPADWYLSECYPNPFNATTRLSFGLPEASQVTIGVYDLSGRLIAKLDEGELNAGTHSAIWESGSASTGVYLIRMEAAGFSAVRKVMLLR